MGAGFLVGVFGVLILSHAAYSNIQYSSLLKITEEEFSGSPINVVMELLGGLVLCIWAALTVPGKFLSILPHSDENSWHDKAMLFEQYHWKKAHAKNQPYKFKWNQMSKEVRDSYYLNWPVYFK